MEYKNKSLVLFEVVANEDDPSKAKFKILPGQELPVSYTAGGETKPYYLSVTREDKEKYAKTIGSVVVVDGVGYNDTIKFYAQKGKLEPFADSVTDPKVEAHISTHGGKTMTTEEREEAKKKAEAEAKRLAAEAKNHIVTIPPMHEDVIMTKEDWSTITGAVLSDLYVMLLGPTGCGKSVTAGAIAEALGMKFYAFNFAAAGKPKKYFVGGLQADPAKGTYFVPSEFYTAFTSEEPTLIFLDEITRSPDPDAENYVLRITDKTDPHIYNEDEGIRVQRGKGVRFIAAGNMGMNYTGTKSLDGAFKNRFIQHMMDYLPEQDEIKLVLKKYPYAKRENVERLVKIANLSRQAEKEKSISSSLSTRQVENFAKMVQAGFSIQHVVHKVVLPSFVNGTVDEREDFKNIMQGKGLI
jgi:MoxR-like ATPase